MSVLVDLAYEVTVFRWIYPIQSLIVAATVAVPHYLLIRGPFNRLVVCWRANGDWKDPSCMIDPLE